jgi:hypothetical protein
MNLKKKTQYQDQAGMFTSEIGTIPRLVSTRYRGHILQQYCNKIAETRVSTEDHIPRSNHSWTKPEQVRHQTVLPNCSLVSVVTRL